MTAQQEPLVAVVMGSKSDWVTMQKTTNCLEQFGVAYESKIVSAHRTPDLLFTFAEQAEDRGIKVIIAGAGGSAHLAGMLASKTIVPVLGVPIQSKAMQGIDSLYSIVQMPAGIPVGSMAIGDSGAVNAALLAIQILALSDKLLATKLHDFRSKQTATVLATQLD